MATLYSYSFACKEEFPDIKGRSYPSGHRTTGTIVLFLSAPPLVRSQTKLPCHLIAQKIFNKGITQNYFIFLHQASFFV